MALIPKQNLLKDTLETGLIYQDHRPYIGMSGLGGKCQRKIWYDFRWAYNRFISKRLARIFERGDLEEIRITNDLTKAGMVVTDDQKEIVDATGHIRGHIDGLVEGIPGAEKTVHLLEIKTMNNKRYNDYIKNGIKKTNFTYYVQMNMYMGYLGLKRCLFTVTNKDNEARDYQRYEFEPAVFEEYNGIGFSILTSETPPNKIGDKIWHECKMCDAREICHKGETIKKTCRSCKYVNLEMEGIWSCSLQKDKTLSDMEQRNACGKYELDGVFND